MIKFKFVPKTLKIKKGDSVKWTNESKNVHNAMSKPKKEFRSKYLRKGKTFTHKFKKKGEFKYICVPHNGMKMKGVITVE